MDTAQRYAPGGDIFEGLAAQYGRDAAQRVFAAYQSAEPGAVARILGDLRNPGVGGPTSTAAIFWDQITTDPLAAPLESANHHLGNAVWNVVRHPFVLLALAFLVFLWIGGAQWSKGRLAK